MSLLKVKVEGADKGFVEELLIKLGYEVTEEKTVKTASAKSVTLSPTLLFGKWKDADLNPSTFRKELWARKK